MRRDSHWRCSLFLVLVAVVVPGAALSAEQADATEGADGHWAELTPPSPRGDHVAIYDTVRDRMVVVGGGPRWAPPN